MPAPRPAGNVPRARGDRVVRVRAGAEDRRRPPHIHREHVDSFYVLEGELELMVDSQTVHAHPGDLVHAPPTVVHAFKNSSDGRLRFINLHTPGMRFDEYIRKMDAGEDPDPAEYDSFEVD